MTPLKVFIPLDGSKLAESSLSYLSSLRALGEVEPRLFSVVDEYDGFTLPDAEEAIKREHNLLAIYLREVAADLKKKGAEFTKEPHSPRPGIKICFIRGPQGISIELLDRDPKYT